MSTRASPKAAGRKKVRCPKCTANFLEPTKAVFECPICACSLSANGANALIESPSHQAREGGSGYRMDVLGNDKLKKIQSPMDFVKKEGNGMTQEGMSTDCEQDSVAYYGQGYKKREQQSIMESSQVLNNGDTDGQPSVDSSTIEGTHGRDGMLGLYSPLHGVSKPGNSMNETERGESPPPPLSVGANEEGALVSTTGKHSSDDGGEENSLTAREESNLIAAGEEGIDRQDSMINGVSRNRHLQSQMFQSTRCEFSFKYSLEGGSPLQSDGEFHRKRSSNAKIVSSDATMLNADASDMPLHTPLRVRISKSHEESSDQSEHGRESFGSETDSDDTSGSDFDFPAPWAEGLQDIVLPAPFSQNEAFHPNSETVVSSGPHQLELRDVDESRDHEEFTLQEESRKNLTVNDTKHSSQVTIDSEEFHPGLLQPDEKSGILLGPADRAEITISKLKPISSLNQSIDVSDLASCVSSSMHLGVIGNNEVLVMKDSRQKLNGSGLQERFVGGEEQEGGFKENSQQEKLRSIEPLTNVVQQGTCERLDVVVPSDSRQVLKIKDYGNGTQESIHARSIREANLMNSATLPNQEYLRPKQSAPNLKHTDCSDEIQSISNTDGFQMVGICVKDNHQMTEGLSSSMCKIECSNDVTDVRDGRTANRPDLSHMVNTLEQDLYKLPHEIYRNDLLSRGNSHSALWAQEETAVSAFSEGTFASTSKPKLYHEKKNTQKSSYGKLNGNLGSRVIRSDNGEDQFMPGEVRNLRRAPGASREASLQATSEHVDWEGRINAAEDRGGRPDLHETKGKPGSYSQYPMNNSLGFPSANPQPHAFTSHHYGFAASGTSQIYSYQLPAQSLMHPAAFQNHAMSHCGYHAMSSACVLCSYHQHPHLPPQHIPHCAACCSQQSSSIGLVEHWNCHQANNGSASSGAGSLVDHPQACSSANLIQSYDFPNAESRSQASSAKKYPPYPKSGAAPYVTCKGCTRILQLPSYLPPNEGMMQKLRCGACGKVTKFSANFYGQHRGVVSNTLPPEVDSMGGAANMWPLLGPYGTHNKQLPISSATESIKSSYKYDMIKGNPVLHGSNEVSPQTNNTAASRIPEQNPQGGEFRRVQPRGHLVGTSSNAHGQHDPSMSVSTTGPAHLQNVSGMVRVMSSRNAALRSTDSFGFERSKVNPAASYHLLVDEKEEGLDFGAPRISDGDSLDHSESQIRSPEYNQACRETPHVDISRGAASRGHQTLEQVSDLSEDYGTAAQEKEPGSPLLVLLNQESTRFRLNLEPRVTFEGAKSVTWSPASDSSVYANSLHNRLQKREQESPRSQGSPGHHFVSKGPKYLAGLLRRSLRDFGKGGQ